MLSGLRKSILYWGLKPHCVGKFRVRRLTDIDKVLSEIKQVVEEIRQKGRIDAAHGRLSRIRKVALTRTPFLKAKFHYAS